MKHTFELLGAAAMIFASGCDTCFNSPVQCQNSPKPTVKQWSGKAFHVDADRGDDANDGLAPEKAWKTLHKVNASVKSVKPGDAVLFKRGCMWRGTLDVACGEPGKRTYYGAYGEGPKPILQGSVCRDRPSDWVSVKPGIWATRELKTEFVAPVKTGAELVKFGCSVENGIKATGKVEKNDKDGEFYRVACGFVPAKPMAFNHMQLWGVKLDGLKLPVVVKFKVRGGFRPTKMDILSSHAPWIRSSEGVVDYADQPDADGWTAGEVLLNDAKCNQVLEGVLHMYLGLESKGGANCDLKFIAMDSVKADRSSFIGKDVGNVLFGGEETWGFKKWALDELKSELDYWYDEAKDRVVVKLDRNPAAAYGPIELCKTQVMIPHHNKHDVTVEALTIRYCSGFAFGGSHSENFTVRNCDMYFIGGGLQNHRKEKDGSITHVRYGNGIECWGWAKNYLVERCRLWQVYDAALTPQFAGKENLFDGITYRDNVIWQAEYSYEFWNHSPVGKTYNVIFEHNTCVDAGYCWSHSQRPLRHAAHLMAFDHVGSMSNQVIRNCIFARSAERDLQYYNRWQPQLSIDYNLYYEPLNTLCESYARLADIKEGRGAWLFKSGPKEFARYQSSCGDELHSQYAAPQFVNEAVRDYRLRPGTPGSKAASDGTDMGARNMPGLDQDQSVM